MADIEEEVLDDDEVDGDLDIDGSQRSLRRKRRRRAKREESSVSEAISSNITRILEGLLKDYDKTERPSYPYGESSTLISPVSTNIYYLCKGKPTEVKVNILIRSMGPISEMQMVRK